MEKNHYTGKISRLLRKFSRPFVKISRREIFTRGCDVVRPMVCPPSLAPLSPPPSR